MLKRILFTMLTALVIYSAIIVGYKIFEPSKDSAVSADSSMQKNAIDYAALKDYTLNSGSSAIHYYFFCSANSNDCIYVENTVLKSVEKTTDLDLSTLLEYVDVSSLESNLQTNQLKADWGIASYPAFLACRVQNGTITISNKLEWNPQQPMSTDDITQWLILNNLYSGSAASPTIATPAS